MAIYNYVALKNNKDIVKGKVEAEDLRDARVKVRSLGFLPTKVYEEKLGSDNKKEAAVSVKEFYLLPVGDKLIQYDKLAVNTIVENKDGEVSSCDIACTDNLEKFNADYLRYTTEVCNTCIDHDLSDEYMVIGTSAIVNVELDGAVGMNSGIFNNPFMIWGRYRMDGEKALLSISFQFHHTQMDGAHAGKFLKNLQEEIERLPYLLS